MPNRCKHIIEMIADGYIPRVGDCIDGYNHTAHHGISGTIKCNVDSSNLVYFVVKEKMKKHKIKVRLVTPSTITNDGQIVCRTLLASQHMLNAQNMIDEHFAKPGIFEVWKNAKE